LAELLLAHGADVNAKTGQKQTPMGLAAQNKLKEMVELLRLHGGH
jgi:ankyrin repeat protein